MTLCGSGRLFTPFRLPRLRHSFCNFSLRMHESSVEQNNGSRVPRCSRVPCFPPLSATSNMKSPISILLATRTAPTETSAHQRPGKRKARIAAGPEGKGVWAPRWPDGRAALTLAALRGMSLAKQRRGDRVLRQPRRGLLCDRAIEFRRSDLFVAHHGLRGCLIHTRQEHRTLGFRRRFLAGMRACDVFQCRLLRAEPVGRWMLKPGEAGTIVNPMPANTNCPG